MACNTLPAFRRCFFVQGQAANSVLEETKGKGNIYNRPCRSIVEAVHRIVSSKKRFSKKKHSGKQQNMPARGSTNQPNQHDRRINHNACASRALRQVNAKNETCSPRARPPPWTARKRPGPSTGGCCYSTTLVESNRTNSVHTNKKEKRRPMHCRRGYTRSTPCARTILRIRPS